jgi:hypothetical protein
MLGGFYEVDNTPGEGEKAEGGARVADGAGQKARIGAKASEAEDDLEDEVDPKRANKKR